MNKILATIILLSTCVFSSYAYTISDKCKMQIMSRESCSLTVYKDNKDILLGMDIDLRKVKTIRKFQRLKQNNYSEKILNL